MTDKTSTKQKPTTTKPLFSCWHSWTKPQPDKSQPRQNPSSHVDIVGQNLNHIFLRGRHNPSDHLYLDKIKVINFVQIDCLNVLLLITNMVYKERHSSISAKTRLHIVQHYHTQYTVNIPICQYVYVIVFIIPSERVWTYF